MKFINSLGVFIILAITIWSIARVPGSEVVPTLTRTATSVAMVWTIWNVGYFFRCWGKSKIE